MVSDSASISHILNDRAEFEGSHLQASLNGNARPSALHHAHQNGPIEGHPPLHRQQYPGMASAAPTAAPQERAEAEERLVVTPVSTSSPKAAPSSAQTLPSSEPKRETQQDVPEASEPQASSSKNVENKTVDEASPSAPAEARPLQVQTITMLYTASSLSMRDLQFALEQQVFAYTEAPND